MFLIGVVVVEVVVVIVGMHVDWRVWVEDEGEGKFRSSPFSCWTKCQVVRLFFPHYMFFSLCNHLTSIQTSARCPACDQSDNSRQRASQTGTIYKPSAQVQDETNQSTWGKFQTHTAMYTSLVYRRLRTKSWVWTEVEFEEEKEGKTKAGGKKKREKIIS